MRITHFETYFHQKFLLVLSHFDHRERTPTKTTPQFVNYFPQYAAKTSLPSREREETTACRTLIASYQKECTFLHLVFGSPRCFHYLPRIPKRIIWLVSEPRCFHYLPRIPKRIIWLVSEQLEIRGRNSRQ